MRNKLMQDGWETELECVTVLHIGDWCNCMGQMCGYFEYTTDCMTGMPCLAQLTLPVELLYSPG